MRTRAVLGGAALIPALMVPTGPAHADDSVARGCPSEKWMISVFPLDWQPGDPIDPTGENLLVSLAEPALVEGFGSLQLAGEAFGFSSFGEY